MNVEKMREEFEAWASTEGLNLRICAGSQPNIVYLMAETNFTWRAWQASRESLVIELPALENSSSYHDGADQRDAKIIECRRAIEAAGLKVKP